MTPDILWPAHFPAPMLGDKNFAPIEPGLATDLNNGRTRRRRAFTATPVPFAVTLLFKSDEVAAEFEDWYDLTLDDGTHWFLMPFDTPQGLGPWPVQSRGIYRGPVRVGAPHSGVTRYTWDLLMYLRPGQLVQRGDVRVVEAGRIRLTED